MWLLWLGLAVLQEGAAERLEPRLAAVETSRAAPAEIRALARALKPGDAPWLAARAERLSPLAEVGLLQALGWDESQLGLCVALTRAANGRARALGEQSLRSQLLAFVPASVRRMDEPEEILAALGARGRWRMAADGAEFLQRLNGTLNLSIDPGVSVRALECSTSWEGELGEALLEYAQVIDAQLCGSGHARGAVQSEWIALLPRSSPMPGNPHVLLRIWMDQLQTASSAPERERCWLALISSRWPAAILWAEQQALSGDTAARAALVQLCARGQVAALAFDPRFTAELCAEFASTKDRERALQLAEALAGIGPLDQEGGDTLANLWEGPPITGKGHQALLLQILRAHARLSPGAQTWLDGVAREARDPGLRLLIAELLPASRLDWAELLRWAQTPARRVRVETRLLRQSRLEWPPDADPLLFPRLALRSAGRERLFEVLSRAEWSDTDRDRWLLSLSGLEREELRPVLGLPPPGQPSAREWPDAIGGLWVDPAWWARSDR